MATNKHALIRYKVLDNCFRNPGKRYFIDDLIEECCEVLAEIDPKSDGISLRQIRDDIAFMKSNEGWNIELGEFKEGKKMYYRYANTTFSINNMPLNELEIGQLQSVLDILSQFKGMPQFEFINELIPKLKQGFAKEEPSTTIIEFDNNQYLKGIENLGTLHNAIFYKKVLDISYCPFENEEPFSVIIHPYYLKQYNNRWFLFGYNPEIDKSNWNLALDRIVSIKEKTGKYKINKQIIWTDYFEDIIGVTKTEGGKIEDITLHFFGKTINYIESKPIHGSQKSKRIDNNTLEVKLNLIVNYELERLIISYAENVKVISPKYLRTLIKKRIQDAAKLYEK